MNARTETFTVGDRTYETLSFEDKGQFRAWLELNHSRSGGIWLVLHRKEVAEGRLTHFEALDEALCFGWIDSQLRKLDEHRFILRFSPRRPNSLWSENNKERALRMMRAGRMTEHGLKKIKEARRNGRWSKAYRLKRKRAVPADLERALQKDRAAWAYFKGLATGYQNQYIYWVEDAKREETRKRRIAAVVKRARKGLRPGIDQ
jgi:uncharacterized protein YdeI (YjbR/CyaY-like superfamily)